MPRSSGKGITATAIVALLLAVSASGAAAVSLSNRDAGDHKVTVIEGDRTQDYVVKPGGSLDGICPKGCLVRLNDSAEEPYELEGPEVTWIEGGELLEEQLEEVQAPEPGGQDQPSNSSP